MEDLQGRNREMLYHKRENIASYFSRLTIGCEIIELAMHPKIPFQTNYFAESYEMRILNRKFV